MNRYVRVLLVAVLLTASGSGTLSAFAQITSGQISGRVLDPDGRVIPQAQVTLLNQLNAGERTATTDNQGDFVFSSVQPGTYSLTVTANGFKNFTKHDIALNASDQLSAGLFHMEVGSAAQVISVQADVTPVQTESGERSALLDDKQIQTLLDPARNFLNLTRVLPGVVATSTTGQDQLGIYGMDTVNGVRSEYSTVSMDGVNANTNANRINLVQTPLNTDAISEVKILSNNYQAEDGGTSGSSINAVTKSGTRSFHGTAYYFKRHEQFNAHDYFDSAYWNGDVLPKGINRFNTIGYNLGGPILLPWVNFNRQKDKLFFFFSQEIWPTVHPGDNNPLKIRVPTALERQGIFSTPVGDPQLTAQRLACKKTNDPGCFPNNTIPTSRIDPNMFKLLAILPLPTPGYVDPSGSANYVLNLTEHNPVNQQVLRLDYNISDKWRVYVRGLHMSVGSKGNAAANAPMTYLGNFPVDYLNSSPNLTADLTYIASPTLVNELNIGWAYWSEIQQFPNGPSEVAAVQKSALGITLPQFRPQLNPLGLIPSLTFGGGGLSKLPSYGFTGRFPIKSESSSYGLSDGLTKTWTGHISKIGIYAHIDRFVQEHNAGNFAGAYNFTVSTQNPLDTGNTYANTLLGNYLQYSESTNAPDSDPFTHVLEWYIQDNWKIAKNFTLDYGVRFSYDIPQTIHVGANFVPGTYVASSTPVLYQPAMAGLNKIGVDPRNGNQVSQALIGAVVPGSGNPFDGMVTLAGTNAVTGQGLFAAPRLGFAWDVFGDNSTAVRGGAGVFYNSRAPSTQSGNLTSNPPTQENPIHPFGSVSQLFSGTDTGVIFPSNLAGAVQSDAQWPVFYNYNIGVQRKVGFSSVLDASYVGNLGRHLGQTLDLNALAPGTRFMAANQDPTAAGKPLADNFLRRYIGLGSIPYTEFGGGSNYNSLQVSLTRRFTHGVSLGVNYVWSKTLDYTDSTTATGLANFAPRHAYNYGLASYDRDHSVVINYLVDLPRPSRLWNNLMVREVLDDWQISGITSLIRGAPEGIILNTSGVDLTGGTDGPRALLTANPVLPHGSRRVLRYFNTDAVTIVKNTPNASGQYSNFVGNAGKVVFRGPGTNNSDMSLFKNVRIGERVTLQLRGEFYNVFNHPSFNSVDNTAIYKQPTFDVNGNLTKDSPTQSNGTFGEAVTDLTPRQVQLVGRVSF